MFKRFLFLLLLNIPTVQIIAQGEQQESNLKAAFIYNFTKYVEWENNNGSPEFVIGIIGYSSVANSLSEIAKKNTVSNKRIVVKIFDMPEQISQCNILFIPEKSSVVVQSILDRVPKGVLTISEKPGLAKQGTAFNFLLINDKLKFEVNLKTVYTAGLKVSSQLLKLAIIID